MFNSITVKPKNAQVLLGVADAMLKQAKIGHGKGVRSASDYHQRVRDAEVLALNLKAVQK